MKTTKNKNVVVELILPDGSMSMYVGALVSRDEKQIVLTDAAWVAFTGRRHLFFAGTPEKDIEVEPYPDGMEITLPGSPVIITSWPHDLFRVPR